MRGPKFSTVKLWFQVEPEVMRNRATYSRISLPRRVPDLNSSCPFFSCWDLSPWLPWETGGTLYTWEDFTVTIAALDAIRISDILSSPLLTSKMLWWFRAPVELPHRAQADRWSWWREIWNASRHHPPLEYCYDLIDYFSIIFQIYSKCHHPLLQAYCSSLNRLKCVSESFKWAPPPLL